MTRDAWMAAWRSYRDYRGQGVAIGTAIRWAWFNFAARVWKRGNNLAGLSGRPGKSLRK